MMCVEFILFGMIFVSYLLDIFLLCNNYIPRINAVMCMFIDNNRKLVFLTYILLTRVCNVVDKLMIIFELHFQIIDFKRKIFINSNLK